MPLNRDTLRRGGRLLVCLLLFGVLTTAGLMRSVRAEDAVQAVNSNGNLNVPPAVDPINDTEGYSAVLYDNRNGLPTSEANAIAQTNDGFIWIGSYAGLIRYDGNNFELIRTSEGILNTRCLYADSQDRLWIGTNDFGLFVMSQGTIQRIDKEDQLPSVSIRTIAEAPDGTIYAGTASGIAVIDAELNLTVLDDERISGGMIRDIRTGSDSLIYGITQNGDLFTLRDSKIISFLRAEDNPRGAVVAVLPDPAQPGALYYAPGRLTRVYHGTLENGVLSSDDVWDIRPLNNVSRLEYIGGQIWITTGSGIGKLNGERFQRLENVPMDKLVDHVMTDYEGNLWFTSTGQCVMKIAPNRFLDLFAQLGLEKEIVNTTCLYGDRLFIGTNSGMTVIENGKKVNSIPLDRAATASGTDLGTEDLIAFLRRVRVRSIQEDSKGRLWISTWGSSGLLCYEDGNLTAYTSADGMISAAARTICELADGSIAAAQPDGVTVIRDGHTERRYGAEDGLTVPAILTVTEGFRHELLAGSDGGGIYVIGPEGIKHIGLKDGLKSEVIMRIKRSSYRDIYWIMTGNSIAWMTPDYQVTTIDSFPYSNNYDLYETSEGRVWVLSSNGIYAAETEEMLANEEINPVFYGTHSGLPYIATSNSFSELTDEGDLYIAGVEGTIRVNIEKPFDDLSRIKIGLPFADADGKRYYPDGSGSFTLPGNIRKLTVYPYVFNSSLVDPDVSYRLEGFDLENSSVSRSALTPVDYTNLKTGAYNFVITVKDPMGDSGQTASFRIVKGREFTEGAAGSLILNIASLILMSGTMVYISTYRKRKQLEDRLMLAMLVTNTAMAVGETLSYFLETINMPLIRELMIAGNTVFYIALVLFPDLLWVLADYYTDRSRERVRRTKLLWGIPCFLFCILMIVNIGTGWIFSIGEGNIYRYGRSGIWTYLPVIPVWFYFLIYLIRGFRIQRPLATAIAVLIAARYAGEMLWQGISSTSFMYALMIVFICLYWMNRPVKEETT